MLVPELRVRLEPLEMPRPKPWPAPRRGGETRSSRREAVGPAFLLALLAAAFVPSVLSEVDAAGALRLLATALASLASSGPAVSSAGSGGGAAQESAPITARQSSGSQDPGAAVGVPSLLVLTVIALTGRHAFRRRRCRSGLEARAPPPPSFA